MTRSRLLCGSLAAKTCRWNRSNDSNSTTRAVSRAATIAAASIATASIATATGRLCYCASTIQQNISDLCQRTTHPRVCVRTGAAFAVVQCVGERRPYGNVLLQKGVVGPDGKDLLP
jgi:L-fucose mutarotase/ribose pyranase (RbsD/FucU family)